MTTHLFISPRAQPLPRWQHAFPDATLAARPGARRADVVWWMPPQFDASALAALIADLPAGTPLVVLSSEPSQADAMQALAAGARAYCHAYATPAMLQQVAVVVLNGGLWLGPELMSTVMGVASKQLLADVDPAAATRLDALTPRERAVAIEVAHGATNKEVARRLDITERTVKAHLSAVFEKLGVRDRLQLVLELKQPPASVDRAA